jgi:hypothetical protein
MLASAALLMVFCTIVALNPQSRSLTPDQRMVG